MFENNIWKLEMRSENLRYVRSSYMLVIYIVMCSTRSDIMIPYVKRTFSIVIIFMQIKQYDDGSNDIIQIMVIRASLPKRDIHTMHTFSRRYG